MAVHRKPFVQTGPAPVETLPHVHVHGIDVGKGTEVTADGIRGRCAVYGVLEHVESGAVWLDVVTTRGRQRSIRPSAIRTVHRRGSGIKV